MEIDKQWYCIEWENDEGEEEYSQPFELYELEEALNLLKQKRDIFPQASIWFNAEISHKLEY